ncbi:MarR family transcriptional regulator [Crossiella sp. SN42]|uniref:GbsR/MarR family transcriptional regulator n=1 Tax=Crossiella sp. SN42 TaxID=2944808 RepID=UPI00207D0BDA|nr:MarR family transcriptional regulator [Crossiella sp. SN42]MCO1578872.1 MarR family transcriptional regulator [Crossiella sp. SN42]
MSDRDAGRDAVAREFLERLAVVLSDSGYPRMAARVFSALLLSPDGKRTAADLAETLQVSPSAVSGAIKYLLHIGIANREREPGERVDHYRVRQNAWFAASTASDAIYRRFEEVSAEGVAIFGAEAPQGSRLAETQRFFAFLRDEIPRLMRDWAELEERRAAAGDR